MSFSVIQITAKGRNLLAKAQTGTNINFTRIKMGDGSMSGQVIDDMSDVINQKANLTLNALKVLTGGKAKVQAVFSNAGQQTGFYWREIAVFATDPDNAGQEIMYCYGNAGSLADYIPAEGTQIIERVVSVLTIISNASNVTATVDYSNVYITTTDAEATYIKKSLATAADQMLVSSATGTWIIKTLAQVKTWLGLGSAAYTNSSAYVPVARKVNAKPLSADIDLAGSDILATGYTKSATPNAVAATDTLNQAIGKLEKQIEDKQSAPSSYNVIAYRTIGGAL